MQTNEIILQSTTEQNLINKMKVAVEEILSEKFSRPKNENQLITRDEACKLLNINRTTLWSYTKKGKLQSYGIGSRVYYKRDEVIASLIPLKK